MEGVVRRRCTLYRGLRIEEAGREAWRALAGYHYRGGRLGVVAKVYALVSGEGRRRGAEKGEGYVGVIVYAWPGANVRMRNVVLGERYGGERAAGLRRLNREMRTIHRVVIHPRWRGIGLGTRLVRETLGRVGTRYVEALAVMGRVNPFLERAGMRRYEGERSRAAARMARAFEEAGIARAETAEAEALEAALGRLGERERRKAAAAMWEYGARLRRSLRRRQGERAAGMLPGELVQVVAAHVTVRPWYYIWERKESGERSQETG